MDRKITVTHELNNITAALSSSLSLIRLKSESDSVNQLLQIMEQQMEKLKILSSQCSTFEIESV